MPNRLTTRGARRDAPTPFSSAWLEPPAGAARSRRSIGLPVLPTWFPGERMLSAILVLLLVGGTAFADPDGGDEARRLAAPAAEQGLPDEQAALVAPAGAAPVDPSVPTSTATALIFSPPTPSPTPAPVPDLGPAMAARIGGAVGGAIGGELLPTYRILAFYGHPHNESMGILGELEMDELRAELLAEAANYEAADPTRPILPAFEVIATVAQGTPQNDGTYIADTDDATLASYADYTAANDLLLFLDLQIGRSTVATEIEKVRSLLERPNVHLALDPEFAIAEGEIPGEYIGELTAESITYAQETLAAISAEHGLPPKVLIVHQFLEEMIVNKELLAPVPGVQFVLDADGFGGPEIKRDVYNILVRDDLIEFGGLKLFYQQDLPLMSAGEVLALSPAPDVIIYH